MRHRRLAGDRRTCTRADRRLILTGMPKKPQRPPPPTRWEIYKIASKQTYIGDVEAADEREAVEKAAVEFKVTHGG